MKEKEVKTERSWERKKRCQRKLKERRRKLSELYSHGLCSKTANMRLRHVKGVRMSFMT